MVWQMEEHSLAMRCLPLLHRIERDVGLKTFFAGRDQGEEIPTLCAKSSWRPPLPPRLVDYRINRFLKGLQGLF
jgi:hypothetical protein